jgi:hypothetical protein
MRGLMKIIKKDGLVGAFKEVGDSKVAREIGSGASTAGHIGFSFGGVLGGAYGILVGAKFGFSLFLDRPFAEQVTLGVATSGFCGLCLGIGGAGGGAVSGGLTGAAGGALGAGGMHMARAMKGNPRVSAAALAGATLCAVAGYQAKNMWTDRVALQGKDKVSVRGE